MLNEEIRLIEVLKKHNNIKTKRLVKILVICFVLFLIFGIFKHFQGKENDANFYLTLANLVPAILALGAVKGFAEKDSTQVTLEGYLQQIDLILRVRGYRK